MLAVVLLELRRRRLVRLRDRLAGGLAELERRAGTPAKPPGVPGVREQAFERPSVAPGERREAFTPPADPPERGVFWADGCVSAPAAQTESIQSSRGDAGNGVRAS